MRELTITAALLAVALVHLVPITGVLGGARLAALYGSAPDDATTMLLMRHRAILFGILGALLALGAFVRTLQPVAIAAGAVSVVSFLILAAISPGQDPAIARIVRADGLALGCLALAAALRALGD